MAPRAKLSMGLDAGGFIPTLLARGPSPAFRQKQPWLELVVGVGFVVLIDRTITVVGIVLLAFATLWDFNERLHEVLDRI
jgi:hypothetical protein